MNTAIKFSRMGINWVLDNRSEAEMIAWFRANNIHPAYIRVAVKSYRAQVARG